MKEILDTLVFITAPPIGFAFIFTLFRVQFKVKGNGEVSKLEKNTLIVTTLLLAAMIIYVSI